MLYIHGGWLNDVPCIHCSKKTLHFYYSLKGIKLITTVTSKFVCSLSIKLIIVLTDFQYFLSYTHEILYLLDTEFPFLFSLRHLSYFLTFYCFDHFRKYFEALQCCRIRLAAKCIAIFFIVYIFYIYW